MPRRPRPIHTERVFHVFNRGNYKGDVFAQEGAARAFLEALDETLQAHRWELFAYAIMPNHFHLCLRTPDGDLSRGMHRLLSAFATRFNRFRKESGHVFQGRFKCEVAPKGMAVRRIIDYIHLNHARAGLLSVEETRLTNLSSLQAYMDPSLRRRYAIADAFERFVGHSDTPGGRQSYLESLRGELANDPKGRAFKADFATGIRHDKLEARMSAGSIKPELRMTPREAEARAHERWESVVGELMAANHLTEAEIGKLPKRHPTKLRLARELKKQTGAPYRWIAARLNAGTEKSLRVRLSVQRGQAVT